MSGFGVFDICGNVFEWTSGSKWRNLALGGFFQGMGPGAASGYGFYPYPGSPTEACSNVGFTYCYD